MLCRYGKQLQTSYLAFSSSVYIHITEVINTPDPLIRYTILCNRNTTIDALLTLMHEIGNLNAAIYWIEPSAARYLRYYYMFKRRGLTVYPGCIEYKHYLSTCKFRKHHLCLIYHPWYTPGTVKKNTIYAIYNIDKRDVPSNILFTCRINGRRLKPTKHVPQFRRRIWIIILCCYTRGFHIRNLIAYIVNFAYPYVVFTGKSWRLLKPYEITNI